MPYHFLQSVLGFAFVAVWVFIAVTMLRDKLIEARSRRVSTSAPEPHIPRPRRRRRHRGVASKAT